MSSVYLLSDMMKKYPVPWSGRSKDAATSIHVYLSGNPSACLANVEFTLGSHSPGASNQMRVCPSSYYFSSGQGSSRALLKMSLIRYRCCVHSALCMTNLFRLESLLHIQSLAQGVFDRLCDLHVRLLHLQFLKLLIAKL